MPVPSIRKLGRATAPTALLLAATMPLLSGCLISHRYREAGPDRPPAVGVPSPGVSTPAGPASHCGQVLLRGGPTGRSLVTAARCLEAAHRTCRSAVLIIDTQGVDTVRVDTFTVMRRGTTCVVAVTASFTMVPRPPTVTSYLCATVSTSGGLDLGGCSDHRRHSWAQVI